MRAWIRFKVEEASLLKSLLQTLGYMNTSCIDYGASGTNESEAGVVIDAAKLCVEGWDRASYFQKRPNDFYEVPWPNLTYLPPGYEFVSASTDDNGFTVRHTTEAACHCQNLLAGHSPGCAYHNPEQQRGVGLWGIKRVEAKTRAEINAEHMSLRDYKGRYK
jgi:hypothetical protein